MKHQRSHEKKHDPKCELVFSIKDGAVCTCKPIEETPSPKCTCGGNYHDSACQLQQFNDRELPSPELAEKCDCKDESCKEDCKRNHTHKRFFCEKCEPVYPDVPEEKPYRQTRPDGWTRTDKCRHSLSTLCSYCEPPEKPVEECECEKWLVHGEQFIDGLCSCYCHKKPEPQQNKVDWEGKPLVEALAELEHEQWIAWSKNIAETETISPERLKRWKVLWCPYNLLTESVKDQDREWARKVKQIITQTILSERKALKDKIQVWVGTRKIEVLESDFNNGYQEALDDLLAFLKRDEK